MRTGGLVVLCVLGAAALGGGWYFGTAREPAMQTSVAGGTLMFPGLTAHLADAARIEITHQGTTIALVRLGDKPESSWGLQQRGNYPVQVTKLRGMLTALTELRLVEPRTTDPTLFGRLGLADTDQKDSSADLLRVFDSAAKPIAELLVGHRRVRTAGNVPDQVFVRRPGEVQTWLAEGSLQVDADPQLWLDRDIMNIDHSRIAGVVVHRGDAELDFAAKDGKLVLTAPANPPPLEDYKLDDLDRGLELLTFEDVTPDKDAAASKVGDPIGTSVFTTSDGLAVHVTVLKGEKDIWARFSADGGETTPGDKAASDKPPSDKIKDEAAKLNAKLAGWTFQLGSWKQAALTPDLDALKAPPPAPTSAAAPAPTATPAPPAAPPTAPTAAPTAAPAAAQPAAPTAAPSRAPAARKP
ncbi:MAG TPA: DUF4340 domain-containing protein [Acetobacteraceae bacterium]|jgi:hypothetical protein|nr:DUF4340 domain-containing protein [Acetobacteraceae bacterium]